MFANSIPARLVAMRTCMPLPCACAWPHHAVCAWPYHAHAQGYAMHRDLASNQIQNRGPSGNAVERAVLPPFL